MTSAKETSAVLEDLMNQHTGLLKNESGILNTYQAKMHIKPDATPTFLRARLVSSAIKAAIDAKLDQLYYY